MDITANYINYNTMQVSSKKDTGTTNRRELCDILRNDTLFRAVDLEDLMPSLDKPLNLAAKTSLSSAQNSIQIAEGAGITVSGGYVLTVRGNGVEISGGDPYDQAAKQEAADLAAALNKLLRNAGGTMNIVAFSTPEYQKWTEDVSTVMKYFGVDPSRSFTVNGMKYSKNAKGYFESAASSAAQEAYEQLKAANQTYQFADERTRKQIAHLSDYYLSTAPESVREAWQSTLEETGINPFSYEQTSTISMLAMEQDFSTGGNDQIFGDTVESSIRAVNQILERIENPLGEVTKEKSEYMQREKNFYDALLTKLQAL